ncbi:MAG TPA: hydrolase 1, exosortase A system-associated [bacterium]
MEQPVQFSANGRQLFGILHIPDGPASPVDTVVMVTGGPQTRYGSHRLYVLLARYLCERGVAVLRFDYEGMGDSEGEFVGAAGAAGSIEAALAYIDSAVVNRGRKIVWSLCDGASASAHFVAVRPRAADGAVLCNPYIQKELVQYRRHYYKRRLLQRDFWRDLLRVRVNVAGALLEVLTILRTGVSQRIRKLLAARSWTNEPFSLDSLLLSLQNIEVPTWCVLSAHDDVAQEFLEGISSGFGKTVVEKNPNIRITTIAAADHTFSLPGNSAALNAATVAALQAMGCRTLS